MCIDRYITPGFAACGVRACRLRFAVVFLLLLAVSGTLGFPAAAASAEDKPVTITFAIIYLNKEDLPIIRQFNQEQDEIHVNTIVVDAVKTGDIFDNYIHFIKNDPGLVDVFLVDIIRPVEYALLDLARPLDSFIPPSVRTEFPRELLKACTSHDRLYAVPYFVYAGLLYYRKDILHREGLKPPVTWEELIQQSRFLSRKYGLEGYLFEVAKYEGLICTALEYMWGYGGGIEVREDGTLKIDTPENQQALELLVSMLYDPGVISNSELALSFTEEQVENLFVNGKAVFARHWPPMFKVCQHLESPVRDRVGVTVIPGGPAGRGRSTLGGWALAINRYSKQPEAAWKFIEYLVSERVQRNRFINQGDPPARLGDEFEAELYAEDFHLSRIRHLMTNLGSRPAVPFYRVISLIFQTYLYEAVSKKMDPEDALSYMELESNEFLRNVEGQVDLKEVMEMVRRKPSDREMFRRHKEYLHAYSDFLKATLSYDDLQMELFRFLLEKRKYDTANTCRKILDRRREENQITVALDQRLSGLDPHRVLTTTQVIPLAQIYEGLFRLDEKGQAVPVLAKSVTHDAECTVWEITLRDGVRFHDGSPLTAESVSQNLSRLAEYIEAKAASGPVCDDPYLPVEEINTPDDRTILIELKHSVPSLPVLLAHPAAAIVSSKTLDYWEGGESGLDDLFDTGQEAEGVADTIPPLGTGPFAFVRFSREGELTLKRFEGYWREKPDVEFLRFISIISPVSRMLHLKHGNVDMVYPVTSGMVRLIEEMPQARLVSSDMSGIVYLGINPGVSPLDIVEVRQSVTRAIDRNGLVELILRGYGQAADSYLPYNIGGEAAAVLPEPDMKQAIEGMLPYKSKIDTAEFTLLVQDNDRSSVSELAHAIQGQLSVAGLNISIEVTPPGQRGSKTTGNAFFLREFHPFSLEAAAFYERLLANSWLDEESLREKLEHAKNVADTTTRTALLKHVQEELARQLILVPVVFSRSLYGKRIEVKGEKILSNGILLLQQVSLKRRLH